MTQNDTKQTYQQIVQNLKHGRLGSALADLCAMGDWPSLTSAAIAEDAEQLKADYGRMLSFLAEGCDDPQRETLYEQLTEKVWLLADRLQDVVEPQTVAASMGDVILRIASLYAEPYSDELLAAAFEQVADSHRLTHDELMEVHEAILEEKLPEYVRATLLSALILHLLQWFDAEAVELLYIYTLDDQPAQLQMQAWVALVYNLMLHHERMAHLPRLREQYNMLAEENPDMFYDIVTSYLLSREASGAEQRLRNMVNEDSDEEDEDVMKRKTQEFFSFLSEGLDLSYDMFKEMRKLKFFSQEHSRHHWLMPFSLEQPEIHAILEEEPKTGNWIRLLMMSVAQCEQDKYIAVLTMNGGNRRLMLAISDKLGEKGLTTENVVPLPPHFVMINYQHMLYRYFTLHPMAQTERVSPFDPVRITTDISWLNQTWCDAERQQQIVALLLRQKEWQAATIANQKQLMHEPSEAALLSQTYAYYMLAQSDKTQRRRMLEPLMRCRQLYPDSRKAIRMLADLLEDEQDYGMEEVMLREFLTRHADNSSLLMRLGRCLNHLKRHREALEPLFKADMIREGSLGVERELARALFHLGDMPRAESYALKATAHAKATHRDWITAGHIALHNGDIPTALQRYRKCQDQAVLRKDIEQESQELIQLGIPRHVLCLVLDAL